MYGRPARGEGGMNGSLSSNWVRETRDWSSPGFAQSPASSSSYGVPQRAAKSGRAPARPSKGPISSAPRTLGSTAGKGESSYYGGYSSPRTPYQSTSPSTYGEPLSTMGSTSTYDPTAPSSSLYSPMSAFGGAHSSRLSAAPSPAAASNTYSRYRPAESGQNNYSQSQTIGNATPSAREARATGSASARPGLAGSLRKKAARTRVNAEQSAQRKELDSLMDMVLKLQDEGRFSEVPPFMKRIEELQERIEAGFEHDHEVKTGVKPPLSARKNINSRTANSTLIASSDASPTKDTASNVGNAHVPPPDGSQNGTSSAETGKAAPGNAPSTETMSAYQPYFGDEKIDNPLPSPPVSAPETKKPKVFAPHTTPTSTTSTSQEGYSATPRQTSTAHAPVGQVPPGPPVLISDPVPSSSSDDSSQVEQGNTKGSIANARKKFRERRKDQGGATDCLLLVGGQEEQEIIKTLKAKKGSRPGLARANYSNKPSVFATPRFGSRRSAQGSRSTLGTHVNINEEAPDLEKETRNRHHLSLQGYMYKSPPEHKRFSRWRYRHFMLAGPLLSYRKSESKSTSRMINLSRATAEVIQLETKSKMGRFEIRIKPEGSKRVYRLRLKSKRLALEWYVAILNNIKVSDKEMDLAKAEKRRRQRTSQEPGKPSWAPPNERSRIGEDIAAPVPNEDLYAHYRVLGVAITATSSQIKKCYRELARSYHPDKNQGNTDISKFAEIARAYEVLQSADTRKRYDLCERIKKLFREGVVFVMYEDDKAPFHVVMFMDSEFKCIYWQDQQYGSVLHRSHKYVYIRFIQEVLAGNDGFDCPPGKADYCLTLHGDRLGCSLGSKYINSPCDIKLQVDSKEARNDILDGLRELRCRFSELFKQRLDAMKEEGLR
mmetsp:Transcript_20231/g.37590  ORF Transcript_20231/g.37590 Transcript_20231/m.37590 type:complete len:888 (-) Transcript_20231:358-3021(-)